MFRQILDCGSPPPLSVSRF